LAERKKSHGARSGESLVCQVIVMLCSARSSHTKHSNQALYHGGETKSPYSTFQIACLSKRSELMQIKFPTYQQLHRKWFFCLREKVPLPNPHFHEFWTSQANGSFNRQHTALNLEHYWKTGVIPIVCSQKATFKFWSFCTIFPPTSKRNLVQTRSSFKSAIYQVHQNRKRNTNTLVLSQTLHYSHMCNSIIPWRKSPSRSIQSTWVVQVCTSSSTVISQSVHKLFVWTTYWATEK
jgi:hypothetical protein